ncbi:uncharacterized protein Pyn_28008 [Prunus yedoensis var. nudiflora]|uniref:Aminotransferase-like plant mobile domain-containing protein n=1 Tax=Prunus yedoensis var. nudiflora TaxID=2094558 RepID=A0A314UET4_PRUYE|nr:uncharacterized protein Pyn_28008 [Prunus yedoensis var. nudiflora]
MLTPEDKLKLEALRKGASTSPSTSLRFSNWIQFFGDINRNEPCRLAAFISLWLGRFLFCDFSQDCLHARVFPLALVIARGDMIPLAPMFLGHMYRLLDQWFKGIEVSPLPYSKAKESADSDGGLYVPKRLPLICRWSRRMQRKGQNFLELLDNVESFIFRPYCALSEGFRHVPLYADSDDLIEVPETTARGRRLRREAMLSAACFPLPTLGDDHLEASVYYLAQRVRRQLGFNQGVPFDPSRGDPFSLHKVFWTGGNVSEDSNLFALALADKRHIGGHSKAYRNYWNRCFASFSRFHAAHCDRLLPAVVHHVRLVSAEKAISLSEKRNLPFTSKSGEIVGDFSGLKQKLEKPSSRSSGSSTAHGKRKREGSCSVEKKRHAAESPEKFIPKVAASGPPSSKKNAPTVPLLRQQPVASGSSKQTDRTPEAPSSRSTSQVRGKGEKAPTVPRRWSMRILQTQFAGTRRGKGADSGSDVVVVADDDDDGSDEDDAVGTGISTHE